MSVYRPALYRPPQIYRDTLALRRASALRDAERRARREQQKIGEMIEEHGERMSDEGRGLLMGLAETLRGFARVMGSGR